MLTYFSNSYYKYHHPSSLSCTKYSNNSSAITTLMTISNKLLIAPLLLSLLLLQFSEAVLDRQTVNSNLAATSYSPSPKLDCGGACKARCQLSSRPRLCKRACGTCCARCSCVPPGTAGNYEACSCYASLTTHGGQRKCP
ncbi:snakin-2-like [Mercurialis annua]|uniref:snakin-2-like n=1 Tax=Mercurialis annua TaxID=3986 RepID=UPI00215DFA91|nr:snakin-2-like [Mercurialis annua]